MAPSPITQRPSPPQSQAVTLSARAPTAAPPSAGFHLISSRITIPSFQRFNTSSHRRGEAFVLLVSNIPRRLFNVKVLLRETCFGCLGGLCGVKVSRRSENQFSCYLLFSSSDYREAAAVKLAADHLSWISQTPSEQVQFDQLAMRFGLNVASRLANNVRRRRLIHNLDDWHSIYNCCNALAQMKLSMIFRTIKVFMNGGQRKVNLVPYLSEVFSQHQDTILRFCLNVADVFKKLLPEDQHNARPVPTSYLCLRQKTIILLKHCLVEHIPLLSSLRSLRITYFYSLKLMQSLLAVLSSRASLTKLSFRHNNVHSYHLKDFYLPNLKFLDLRHNALASDNFLESTDVQNIFEITTI